MRSLSARLCVETLVPLTSLINSDPNSCSSADILVLVLAALTSLFTVVFIGAVAIEMVGPPTKDLPFVKKETYGAKEYFFKLTDLAAVNFLVNLIMKLIFGLVFRKELKHIWYDQQRPAETLTEKGKGPHVTKNFITPLSKKGPANTQKPLAVPTPESLSEETISYLPVTVFWNLVGGVPGVKLNVKRKSKKPSKEALST
ncbi:hypothetical protein EGW08_004553, partial [Elysia chlorotica]